MPRRIDLRPIVAVGLSAAMLIHVGCDRTVVTPQTGPSGSPAPTNADALGETAPADGKLFDKKEWRAIQAALVISGEMDGYLEPCGCTAGQLGGLGRRYDLLDRMAAQKIPAARIDLGSLTKDPSSTRGGLDQAKVKFDTALKALAAMKYDALALSAEDLKLGIDHTLGVYLNLNQKDGMKVVCANVAPSAAVGDAFRGAIHVSAIAPAGPYKVGVTAVLDPVWYRALKDPSADLLDVKEPTDALPAVLKALEAGSDVQVLMVQGPPELAKSLGERFPGFDVVVSTSPYADPPDKPEILKGDATEVVQVGQKGKYVGVVGLFAPGSGPRPTTRYQRVTLANRYKNAEPMRALIDEEMQAVFKGLGVVENSVRRSNASAPAGATYVGAEGCKSCHPNTFNKWATTGHAKAFDVLVNNPADPKRRREFDAECVSCHTTGFSYVSGWVSPEKTPYLKGNQCENCHGPASKHVGDPDNKEFAAAMHRTAEGADRGGLCIACHDEENSPKGFDFPVRYGKVIHKGMDTYTDPRVHQGLSPEAARASR